MPILTVKLSGNFVVVPGLLKTI